MYTPGSPQLQIRDEVSEAKGPLLRPVLDRDHVVVAAAHVGRARGLAEAVVGVRGVLEVGRPRGHLEAARRRARRRLATLVRVRVLG